MQDTTDYTPLWVRIWHWTVAVLFVILTYTGIVLTFSGQRFALMDYELATTMHDITGVAISIIYVLFIIAIIATGYWRSYIYRWRGLLGRMGRQGKRTLTWSPRTLSETPVMQRRLETTKPFLLLFQQFLYVTSIVVIMPLLILTGIPYLYPETAPEQVMGFAGLWPLALSHYVIGLFGAIFLFFHMYIATVAGFRRMFKGR